MINRLFICKYIMQTIDNLNFSAASAGGRAMKTLRTWGLEIDEGKNNQL